MRRRPYQEEVSQLARDHDLAGRTVAGVESPLEADLHGDARCLNELAYRHERWKLERDGFLTERGHACQGSQTE